MDGTKNSNFTNETTSSPPYNMPPPSYGFSNPMVLGVSNQPGQVPISSMGNQWAGNPNVVYVQPPSIAAVGICGLHPETAHINDYMAWSIFNMLCCGLLLGIIGCVLSSQVQQRKVAGDVEGAKSLSTGTAMWNAFTTLAGIGIIVGICIYLSHYGYF